MQIALLGNVKQVSNSQENQQPAKPGDFSNLLSGLLHSKEPDRRNQPLHEDSGQTEAKMKDLIQLLEAEDISELLNGSEIFQQMISDFEMDKTGFIKEYLQLSDQDLLNSLLSFVSGISMEQQNNSSFMQTSNQKTDQNLNNHLFSFLEQKKEGSLEQMAAGLNGLTGEEAFKEFMNLLPQLNLNEAVISLKGNSTDTIKFLKMFQLMSQYDASAEEQQALKVLLDKVEKTLAEAVKTIKNSNRNEWLNQVFTPLAKEIRPASLNMQQTQTAMRLSQADAAEEQMNENLTIKQGASESFDNGSGLLQFQQTAKNDQLVWMLEKSGKPVSSEQLISQFEKILSNSQMIKTGNTQRLFIKLNPEHLGKLQIELIQKDSAMIAKITAASSQAKELLESQLQQLKSAFGAQNIQLDKIEISMQSNQQEKFLHKDSQQDSKGQEQQEHSRQKEQDSEEFSLSFAEALINTEI